MIWVYRILFLPLLLVALPYYLRRMWKRGGYRRSFAHRFGFVPELPASSGRRVWVHAVSVGELLAITPLIQRLHDSGVEVVLSVTTSTALTLAHERLKTSCRAICVFPIDFWPCSAAAWKRLKPHMTIMMEGELWPEHMFQARSRNVPVVLVNARLSDRSFSRYQRVGAVAKNLMFDPVQMILTGTEQDMRRFHALGIPPERLRNIGQLKCDIDLVDKLDPQAREQLRRSLFPGIGPHSLILLGSSTWAGEESFLVSVLTEARSAVGDVRLLLVPRHAERRAEVIAEIEQAGLLWHLRSAGGPVAADTVIHVADTTGELRLLTQASDVAFIGKSLPPHREGQTPIEAAVYGIPSVMGPGMSNFRQISQSLVETGAAIQAHDERAARSALVELLSSPSRRNEVTRATKVWHASQRGAIQRSLDAIVSLLP